MTTPFLKNHISAFLAMTLCCLIGRSSAASAQHTGATLFAPAYKGEQTTTGLLPYPFPWAKTQSIEISGDAGSNEGDTVIINMLEFWERQTPHRDQQNFAKQSFAEYIQYVQQHLNTTTSKANLPLPKKSDDQQKRHVLQYPFPWATECHIHSPKGTQSNRFYVLFIDLGDYWKYQVPQQAQQSLSKRPFGDYIKYIREHLNKLPKRDGAG
jgi:hypothetical protein